MAGQEFNQEYWDSLTPIEQYTINTWLTHEAIHQGRVVELSGNNIPHVEPHPNEIATRAAVVAGTYTADEVGLDARHLT